MRKSQSKLDKLPQPLTISRKLNLKSLEDPNPYRLGEEIKQNKLSTSRRHSGLAEMKQELLQIKDDMIKLFTTPNDTGAQMNLVNTPDVLYETLKQELNQFKGSEEKLRKEIEKNKGEYLRAMEEMQQRKDEKIEQMRKERDSVKGKYEQIIEKKEEEISILKGTIQEKFKDCEYLDNLLGLQKSKYSSLTTQLQSLQATIRQLKLGNSKQQSAIIQSIETKKLNIELSTRIQSLTFQLQNYKTQNSKLQQQLKQSSIRFCETRNSMNALESNQVSLLERLKETEDQGQSYLDLNNHELNAQRMEIINLELSINDLQEQNYVLTEHNKYVKGLLGQTEHYIKALEFELEKYIRESRSEYEGRRERNDTL